MLKRILISLTLFVLVSFLFSLNLNSTSKNLVIHGPIIRDKNGTSLNWSGYADYNSGPVTDVKGDWIVPNVSCGSINTYSSAWVGIDGYNSGSVEQTGTEQDCINGQPSYYAWYEMYPKPSYRVPLNVNAGDRINAEVKYTGNGNFQLSLISTNGQTFTINQKSSRAQRSSAEWIMEAPYSGGILPLANFGTANYSASSATIAGVTKTINGFTFDQINMVNNSSQLKDQTSVLSPDGSAFSVKWISSN